MVLTTIITRRKSLAVGWRRAMMVLQSSSMPTSMALTLWSLATIVPHSSRSPVVRASTARPICCSTKPPICSTRERSDSSSASNCLDVWVCSVAVIGTTSFSSLQVQASTAPGKLAPCQQFRGRS